MIPMLYEDCVNSDVIRMIIYGTIFLVVIMGFYTIVMIKINRNYKDILVQNKILKRDLELNTILKHEHIQKLLCPHDLITFNNEHIYTTDKCSACHRQCKQMCWAQYFIDKLKHEESVDNDGFFFVEEKNKEEQRNGNSNYKSK